MSIWPVQVATPTWWVDYRNTSGPWDGSALYPFQTVAEAYAVASEGGKIIIRNGTYPENLTMSKQLLIESEGGPVQIGTGATVIQSE